MTPAFVVIGAERSGTTSLYHYLRQHPQIFMPAVKQLNHLIHHPTRRSSFQGPDVTFKNACRSHDEYCLAFADASAGMVIGEIAHTYLYAPESPQMIKEALGTPRIVAVIRDPVDRAYAQFDFHRKVGLEPLSTFEQAVDAEDDRVKAGWDPVYHYVRRGLYGEQLARYYERFLPSDIRIYKFESFFHDPASSMSDLYGFVGADPTFLANVEVKFTPGGDPRAPEFIAAPSGGVPDPKPVAPTTRRRLASEYADDIRTAEHLTGLDLSDWLEEDVGDELRVTS